MNLCDFLLQIINLPLNSDEIKDTERTNLFLKELWAHIKTLMNQRTENVGPSEL